MERVEQTIDAVRHADDEHAAASKDAAHLPHRRARIEDVLEDVRRQRDVEPVVTEGKRTDVGTQVAPVDVDVHPTRKTHFPAADVELAVHSGIPCCFRLLL